MSTKGKRRVYHSTQGVMPFESKKTNEDPLDLHSLREESN